MNLSVDILSVPVADQEQAKAFYVGVLGFVVREDAPFGEGRRWLELVPPAGGTSITLVTWVDDMPAGSLRGTVLGTDDCHKTYAELSSRGVEFSDDVQDASWGHYATFTDPDGNGWVLVGPVESDE